MPCNLNFNECCGGNNYPTPICRRFNLSAIINNSPNIIVNPLIVQNPNIINEIDLI